MAPKRAVSTPMAMKLAARPDHHQRRAGAVLVGGPGDDERDHRQDARAEHAGEAGAEGEREAGEAQVHLRGPAAGGPARRPGCPGWPGAAPARWRRSPPAAAASGCRTCSNQARSSGVVVRKRTTTARPCREPATCSRIWSCIWQGRPLGFMKKTSRGRPAVAPGAGAGGLGRRRWRPGRPRGRPRSSSRRWRRGRARARRPGRRAGGTGTWWLRGQGVPRWSRARPGRVRRGPRRRPGAAMPARDGVL